MENSDQKSQKTTEKPVFQSNIPAHLITSLSPSEKFLVESVSKIEQMADWSILRIIENSDKIQEQEDRLEKLEKWKNMIASKIGVFVVLGGIVGTAFLHEGAKFIFSLFTHIPK